MTSDQFRECLDYIEKCSLASALWDSEESDVAKQRAWNRLKAFVDSLKCDPPYDDIRQLKKTFSNKRQYIKGKLAQARISGNGRVRGLNPLEQRFQNILETVPNLAHGRNVGFQIGCSIRVLMMHFF